MFARQSFATPSLTTLDWIEGAVRDRYHLSDHDIVLVTEEPARLLGGPARMTTILFWVHEARHRIRLFTPAAQITAADLPPAWLRGALLDDQEADCC